MAQATLNAVVVGADRLGNIPEALAAMGVHMAHHISGRHAAHQRKLPGLPRGTQLLILLTDFLGHNAMRHFRDLARAQAVPIVCCRRSTVCVAESVQRCLARQGGCAAQSTGNCQRR
jgi:hypothetical protein